MVDSVISTPTVLGVIFFKGYEVVLVFFPTDLKMIQPGF